LLQNTGESINTLRYHSLSTKASEQLDFHDPGPHKNQAQPGRDATGGQSRYHRLIMKIGIIISALIVLLVTGVILIVANPPADKPTSKTAPEVLAKQALPADLPRIVEAPAAGEGDARAIYGRLFKYYATNARQLEGRNPSESQLNALTRQVKEAAGEAYAGQGFFDDQFAFTPGAQATYGAALEMISGLVLNHARESKNDAQIREAAQAVWIMGNRAYEHGQAIYVRREGLRIMSDAISVLYQVDKGDAQQVTRLQAWLDAIGKVAANWDAKTQMIRSVRQPIADLLNIAQNDQDPAFRAYAISWLGVAKFNPGNRGNEKAIHRVIQASINDPDPAIAQAGKEAESFTREQLRKLH
jgi:hypothetical protein